MALQIQGLGFIFVAGPMALVALLMSCLEPGCGLIVSLSGGCYPRASRTSRSAASQTSLCAVLAIFGSEVTSTSLMVAWRLFDSDLVQDVLPTWSRWRFEAVVPPGLA